MRERANIQYSCDIYTIQYILYVEDDKVQSHTTTTPFWAVVMHT